MRFILLRLFIVVVSLWLTVGCQISSQEKCLAKEGAADYKVAFHGTWSAATHPAGFPLGAHFSSLIGTTHNSLANFWKAGDLASPGIELMAETGSQAVLRTEINQSTGQGNAEVLISGTSFPSPGSDEVSFSVSSSHSFVTLVSMLAPSPDWFIGVRNLNLCENNEWVETKIVNLYVYDAGTDSGSSFTSADQDTFPKETISKATGDFSETPIGTFTFIKQ